MKITGKNAANCLVASVIITGVMLLCTYVINPSAQVLGIDLFSMRGAGFSFAFVFIAFTFMFGWELTEAELEKILAAHVKKGQLGSCLNMARKLRRELTRDELEAIFSSKDGFIGEFDADLTQWELEVIFNISVRKGWIHSCLLLSKLLSCKINRMELRTILAACEKEGRDEDALEVKKMIAAL